MITSNNVNFYFGVVVDVNDPEKANRVKVRILGLHDNTIDIKNKHLPWALVSMPTTGSSTTGIGTNHGLVQGSFVLVYFVDGEDQQIPLVLGSISGLATGALIGYFKDPDNKYPLQDRLNEPDVNRLARNEKISETIIQTKRDTETKGVPIASGGTWDELSTAYGVKYPNNKVIETTSGHVIEVDDTPGAERLHIWHKSGSSVEWHPDGSVVIRNNNKYEITSGDEYVNIKGNVSITVNGNADVKVNGNTTVNTSGNTNISTGGNMNLTAGGNMKLQASRIDLN